MMPIEATARSPSSEGRKPGRNVVAVLDTVLGAVLGAVLGVEFGTELDAVSCLAFGAAANALDVIVLSYTDTGMSKITCILL